MGVEGKVKEKVDTSKAGVGIALPRKKKNTSKSREGGVGAELD